MDVDLNIGANSVFELIGRQIVHVLLIGFWGPENNLSKEFFFVLKVFEVTGFQFNHQSLLVEPKS